jgi:hypothetical protein
MSDAAPRRPSATSAAQSAPAQQPEIRTYVAERPTAPGAPETKSAPADTIIDHELEAIMRRRLHIASAEGRMHREDATLELREGEQLDDLTGLALSGGGIRSSTFCLGVAQALHQHGVIDRLDYLSTVSGGSYFGSSLTATMAKTEGDFVFGGAALQSAGGTVAPGKMSSDDLRDSPAVGHLRNYSNYLVPGGLKDFLTAAAVVVRGLATNAALILWFPIVVAAITVFSNPSRNELTTPDLFGYTFDWLPQQNFAFTLLVAAVAVALFFLWGLFRSAHWMKDLPDVRGWEVRLFSTILIVVAVIAFFEFQPFVIELLFESAAKADTAGGQADGDASGSGTLLWFTTLLAPVAAIATFFRETIKAYLEDTYYSKTYAALLSRGIAFAILWAGALALPLLIWVFYVHLSFWAIPNNDGSGLGHTPGWLKELIEADGAAWSLYLKIGLGIAFFAFWLSPNSNSLHHLYRDRLARAFHFDPGTLPPPPDENFALLPQTTKDPDPLDKTMLVDMLSPNAPYHLINTAINVGSSSDANRRGRNADFFLFSPLFVGSRVTGYVPTHAYGEINEPIELAKAVAISGAAASSNMGSRTIRPLSPTIAMLNVRLGYWLTNPAKVAAAVKRRGVSDWLRDKMGRGKPAAVDETSIERPSIRQQVYDWLWGNGHVFLFKEMFGFLREDQSYVYLTDGGHIENLGVYELLRRRCRVIIAVDAEADPQMRFGSFITLQIYARVDLGIRIDLPLDAIREATLAAMKRDVQAVEKPDKDEDDAARKPGAAKKPETNGPHVAIGTIHYGDGHTGTLVYIKASLSGDENDYIRDYSRRNPTYPHESTGDQFFTEEQFEVYRALGFHCADRFLCGKDKAIVSTPSGPQLKAMKASAVIPSSTTQSPTKSRRSDPRLDEVWSHLGPF